MLSLASTRLSLVKPTAGAVSLQSKDTLISSNRGHAACGEGRGGGSSKQDALCRHALSLCPPAALSHKELHVVAACSRCCRLPGKQDATYGKGCEADSTASRMVLGRERRSGRTKRLTGFGCLHPTQASNSTRTRLGIPIFRRSRMAWHAQRYMWHKHSWVHSSSRRGCSTEGEAARAPRRASGEYALVRTNRRAGARPTLNWGHPYSPELPATSHGTLQHSVRSVGGLSRLLLDKRPMARRRGAPRFVWSCCSAPQACVHRLVECLQSESTLT
jgi:hypothetical protein